MMSVATNTTRWVVRRRVVPAPRLRLFLFAHGGGSASSFLGWDAHFPADVELCAVQLPGREGLFTERPYTRLDALVRAAAAELTPLMQGPFAMFGHSMGALVAYELARLLRARRGLEPTHFFASAYPGPRVARHHVPGLHTLPDDALIAELQRLGGVPAELLASPELMSLCLPIVRADFEVCETWQPPAAPGLSCPVLALGGDEDSSVGPAELDAWRDETLGPFDRVQVAGNHFYHMSPSSRGRLFEILVASLAREFAV